MEFTMLTAVYYITDFKHKQHNLSIVQSRHFKSESTDRFLQIDQYHIFNKQRAVLFHIQLSQNIPKSQISFLNSQNIYIFCATFISHSTGINFMQKKRIFKMLYMQTCHVGDDGYSDRVCLHTKIRAILQKQSCLSQVM